jgi:hypothetical protein
MSLLLRSSRLLPLAGIAALPALAAAACNAQVATVLNSDAGPDATPAGAACSTDPDCNENPAISSLRGRCSNGRCACNPGVVVTASGKCGDVTTDGGAKGDCEAKGGMCVGPDATPPPTYRKANAGEGTCANGDACWVKDVGPSTVCTTDKDCNGDPSVSSLWGKCFYGLCMCKQGFTVQPDGKCGTKAAPDCKGQGGTCRQEPATCQAGELASGMDVDMSCGDFIPAVCCQKAGSCKGIDFVCCMPNDAIEPPICVNGWKTCPATGMPFLKDAGTCGG